MAAIDDCRKVRIADATTPKNGYVCWVDHFWVVTPEDEILFYVGGAYRHSRVGTPQCNSNERVAQTLSEKLYPGCTVKRIPVVFVSNED